MLKLSLAKEREILALSTRKGRKRAMKIMVEGARAIDTLISQDLRPEYLVVAPGALSSEAEKFLKALSIYDLTLYTCDNKRFQRLSDTMHSQGLIAVVERELSIADPSALIKQARFVVYLDGISDPGNLGTIIRSAAAFNVDFLATSSGSADFDNPKTVRASAGLIFRLPLKKVEKTESFFDALESNNLGVIGSDARAATDLKSLSVGDKVCLAIGSEAHGLSDLTRSRCRTLFRIKTAPTVESLNAASAAAVMMHELAHKLELL